MDDGSAGSMWDDSLVCGLIRLTGWLVDLCQAGRTDWINNGYIDTPHSSSVCLVGIVSLVPFYLFAWSTTVVV